MESFKNYYMKTCELLENSIDIPKKWRPCFHLASVRGWMNDPNGLCEVDGLYHIFFQYSPLEAKAGANFWGHYTTKNFIDYSYHKPALCCDEAFDCHGVYSGSAIVENKKINLFYTGNVKHIGMHDYITSGREHNQIYAESENGLDFINKRLLLMNKDYPENMSCHVRDPKVWKRNGKYYMLLGARTIENKGECLLYESNDKFKWTLLNIITSKNQLGYMWECPDYFQLGEEKYMIFCPQGIAPDGMKYNNTHQCVWTGISESIKHECVIDTINELDCGFDFYAAQTFIDSLGRRILIAWMGLPDSSYSDPTDSLLWMNQLTLPRELKSKNGRLCQSPISELKKLRNNKIKSEINGKYYLSRISIFEAEIKLKSDDFKMLVRECCRIKYSNGVFSMKFLKNGYGRTERKAVTGKITKIHLYCDSSSIEVFINNGEKSFSTRYFPKDIEQGIYIETGEAELTVWELGSFNIVKEE